MKSGCLLYAAHFICISYRCWRAPDKMASSELLQANALMAKCQASDDWAIFKYICVNVVVFIGI